ncbi:MAG: Maf family protein [Bacteroides sp.]|nr:Maf family protein [Bacillota bacterium]MCM1393591.1 Maf family protein [[Eubacterium] siraeum]MCM1454990.1 Maf family protein [Bacteroides sp.]
MKFSKRIILASASPRRREILDSMGLTFDVMPTNSDESVVKAKCPRTLVKRLSALKADAIEDENAIVIGADTVVAFRGEVFGKPRSIEEAAAMLKRLGGHWHSVYTGVTLKCGKDEICFSARSRVKIKSLSDEEIASYFAASNPLDKAGAYGIQDGRVVQKYSGSYTNIVGLPKEKLAKALARVGI